MRRIVRKSVARFGSSAFRFPFPVLAAALLLVACGKGKEADAFGNFETDEVSVSAQSSGQLKYFSPVEGQKIASGVLVAVVDTTQAALELNQVIAQRSAVSAKANEAGQQVGVYEAQRAIAERNYNRIRRLFAEKAATAQQLDQAERDYRVVVAQIAAARAARTSVVRETESSDARVAQIRDRIVKSRVINPVSGTVIAAYAHQGEVIQAAQPLYRIANLDTLTLRAYVSESQLGMLRLGQTVTVNADRGDGRMLSVPGVVTWIAGKSEFTPTPVQTRDERADLVYAVKVRVPDPRGELKIGMPGDIVVASQKQ